MSYSALIPDQKQHLKDKLYHFIHYQLKHYILLAELQDHDVIDQFKLIIV